MSKLALNEPFTHYRQALTHTPVHYNKEMDAWHIFRYADIKRVLNSAETFSSEIPFVGKPLPLDASIISLDNPRHSQLRPLSAFLFASYTIEAMEPHICNIVDELLDRVIERGQMDIIDDLASPLAITIMAQMIGMPEDGYARIKRWAEQISCASEPDGSNAQAEMSSYFSEVIEQRRRLLQNSSFLAQPRTRLRLGEGRSPANDLLRKLLTTQEHLTHDELLGFCILMSVAGTITVTHLIGNTLLCLTEQRSTLRAIRTDHSLIPATIEEVLRYRSPVQSIFRVAAKDTTIGEQKIEKGQLVVAFLGAANRDPAVFTEPEKFDIWRKQNMHLAFGRGTHYCQGASLGRLEAQIVLQRMLARLRRIKRLPDYPLQGLNPAGFLYGVQHLPITFSKV